MTWTTPPPKERTAGDACLSGHLLDLLASVAGYLRARLELAGIEGKDAAALWIKVALLLVVALGLLCFGYAFLWIGLITLVASHSPVHWGWIVLGAGALHLVLAGTCTLVLQSLWKKPVFKATLEEFRKDQEWLKSRK